MFEQIENFKNLEILQHSFLNNTLFEYVLFGASFLALFLVIKIFEQFLLAKLKNRQKKIGEPSLKKVLLDFIISIKTGLYLYLAFFVSLSILEVADGLMTFLTVILAVWVTARVMIGIHLLIDYTLNKRLLDDADPGTEVAAKNMGTIFKALLWIFAVLLLLSNFGVEVTSLVAGLGVGGVAIAFALQNVLEDLFSSFAIYFDKPFTVGDFIIVGDQMGVVEKIGIKTTRIRALQGEEVVISNKELTTERVHNFKKLEKRRSLFEFGVVYSTDTGKMRRIPDMVKEIIEDKERTEFDRAHFKGFGDSALEYEVSYYVLSSEFKEFRDIHEKVLLDIKEKFEEEGIGMAFPTRTVHLFNK